ncbi:MAG: SMP-30/gluconolactonase/LRE family protein, partial [Candidatus Sulfotelmatobacter sp.]
MFTTQWNHTRRRENGHTRSGRNVLALFALFSLVLAAPLSVFGGKKKKQEPQKPPPVIDYSNIVWPNPPAVARIRYQAFYSAEKLSQVDTPKTKKDSWMDRLAGTTSQADSGKVLWQLAEPYGMAIDSKGNLYVADQKVGAIFIFNTETREVQLIKNKTHGHFVRIIGLAMDDNDRLFVSDPGLSHILVFNANHEAEDVITEGLVRPGAIALDTENRLLYVSDVDQDQVLVYDADTLKLKRKMGTGGQKHALTSPGDFARPGGLAIDSDGNLYVADTLNDRIEIFDGDG